MDRKDDMKVSTTAQYQILPGAAGIKAVYELALGQKQLDVICLSDQYGQVIGDYFDNVVAPKLYGSDIVLRELLPATPENEQSELVESETNQRRFLQLGDAATSAGQSDLLIGDNMVVVISFNQETPAAIVMNDVELVKSFRVYFEKLWEKA